MALSISEQARILDDELRRLGNPLPDPVARLGTAGLRQRTRQILVEQGTDPFGPNDWRRAVRQAISEAIDEDAMLDQVRTAVAAKVRGDAIRAQLAARTLDLDEFGPAARANVIDLYARRALEARGIDDPTEEQYLAAVAKADDEVTAAGL